MKKIIAIVGDAFIDPNGEKFKTAFAMGKALVDNGYRIQSGGLRGVMEAAFMGAKSSEKTVDGDTVAILPSFNVYEANDYADIAIPTGLDMMRNMLVANASAVIAIGGGAGTLSEIALAWSLKRLIIAFNNVEGWSAKVADTRLDNKQRYNFEDKIYGVSTPEQAIEILKRNLSRYDDYHHEIPMFIKKR